jgi:hypothetical protein
LVDILALFRHRRAPQPRRRAGNGGWQDIGLTSLGGPMALARGKKVAPAATVTFWHVSPVLSQPAGTVSATE